MQYSLLRFDELQHLYTHLNHVSVTHKFGKFTEKKVILFFQGFEFVLGNRFSGANLLMKKMILCECADVVKIRNVDRRLSFCNW